MSLATTFTKDKILEMFATLQASIESVYAKKGVAVGIPAGRVPTAVGDDTYTWQALPIGWKKIVDPATDVRPDALHVIWVGDTVAPTNMTSQDAWIPAP